MKPSYTTAAVAREGRTLLSLLHSAEAAGFMLDPGLRARWSRVRDDAHAPAPSEAAAVSCYDLMLLIEHRGHLAETPIEQHWRAARARIAKWACDQDDEPRHRWRPTG